MINLSLDRHDFLCAVEGFAHGSHLRQHVWKEIVYKSISQMSDDDMDFLWFFMRRDIFECYFYELNGKKNTHFGYEDFMHALAALIDKISGKGTWESNPWVFVYDFELVK